jgi:hypothetical protein
MNKTTDSLVLGIILGTVLTGLLSYILSSLYILLPYKGTESYPPAKIKVEYYLEVSQDSIKIQSADSNARVYVGKYSDLDSLITIDNQ